MLCFWPPLDLHDGSASFETVAASSQRHQRNIECSYLKEAKEIDQAYMTIWGGAMLGQKLDPLARI